MRKYDPSTATITDKVFVATMFKTLLDNEAIIKGMPNSVYDYMRYTIDTVVDNINAEITLDVLKNVGGKNE